MDNKKGATYVTALFDSIDSLKKFGESIQKYPELKCEVFSSFPIRIPIPGVNRFSDPPSSFLLIWALRLGLLSFLLGGVLIYFTSAIDYPLLYGGKDYFNWPSVVPVLFEMTIFGAVHGAFFIFLYSLVNRKLTNSLRKQPSFLPAISNGQYGVLLKGDSLNASHPIVLNLKQVGGLEINLKESESEGTSGINFKWWAGVSLGLALPSSVLTYFIAGYLVTYSPFNWMEKQSKYQTGDALSPHLEPVAGTVAEGFLPYSDALEPNREIYLLDPLEPSKEMLKRGQSNYDIFCAVCHDKQGLGEHQLTKLFPKPPSLKSERVKNMSDGRLFHIISNGKGLMKGYKGQLKRVARWEVVNYLRTLTEENDEEAIEN